MSSDKRVLTVEVEQVKCCVAEAEAEASLGTIVQSHQQHLDQKRFNTQRNAICSLQLPPAALHSPHMKNLQTLRLTLATADTLISVPRL